MKRAIGIFVYLPKIIGQCLSHANIKKHCHKKSMCIFIISVKKTFKVAAFAIFWSSIMVLFEIHKKFKGHFLNELCVSFKGQNCISYSGSEIWNSIPAELREISSFQVLKSEIKVWRPTNCPCKLCKNYIENLVFINIAS